MGWGAVYKRGSFWLRKKEEEKNALENAEKLIIFEWPDDGGSVGSV